MDKIEEAFNFASEARERFKNGTPETKRQVAINLGVKFIYKEGGVLLIELTKNGQGKEKTMAFESMISSWQGLADEFGTFDWQALYQDMCVFPAVAVRILKWETITIPS